jgi:ribosomal protein RSM22 (predicted rRNA methylase)
VNYPGDLDASVARWLEGRGAVVAQTAEMRRVYRAGENSSGVDLAAYLVARAPATYAANVRVQKELALAWPDFAPQSLLDVGTGPGTASWAAVNQWADVKSVHQCEQDSQFADLASTLNASSAVEVLQTSTLHCQSEAALSPDVKADLVVASYMLAELPITDMAGVALRLWARADQVLVLIEPGTPQGFERLRIVRKTMIGEGAFVIAPCTHQLSCPTTEGDWCHFKTRVQRSRAHMHAKQASVPFEDEAFSYLVLARTTLPQAGGRVVAPVKTSKISVTLPLCDGAGLHDVVIAARDKSAYKRAKKTVWGDVWA